MREDTGLFGWDGPLTPDELARLEARDANTWVEPPPPVTPYGEIIAAIKEGSDLAPFVGEVNAMDGITGETPIFFAAATGNAAVTHWLIANGADINLKDEDGGTALTRAIGANRAEIVSLLLANGSVVTEGAAYLAASMMNRGALAPAIISILKGIK